jgi:Fe-S oxidoreductase
MGVKKEQRMEAKTPYPEVSAAIVASGADTLYWCLQCGLCTGSCPWRLVPGHISESFNIRKVQLLGQLGQEGFESEEVIYGCTTCAQCVVRCPRQVDIIGNIGGMRRMLASVGTIPNSYKPVIGSLHAQGNPWPGERSKRTEWMKDLDVPAFKEDTEYFLFVCCTSCYDARSQKIARSVVKLLQKAGVNFGVIGEEESCCGESVLQIGEASLFQKLAQGNIALFQGRGVKRIITTSPHCFNTFRKDYPELGGDFDVINHSQLLRQLVGDGKLKPSRAFGKKIAYHDPCCLGRKSEIFRDPRELLAAVPGADIKEMDRALMNSLCCGGGGGRIWMETAPGERFGDLLVAEALGKGAQVLATACPYCVVMLEASCKTMGKDELLSIMDLSEVLLEAVE